MPHETTTPRRKRRGTRCGRRFRRSGRTRRTGSGRGKTEATVVPFRPVRPSATSALPPALRPSWLSASAWAGCRSPPAPAPAPQPVAAGRRRSPRQTRRTGPPTEHLGQSEAFLTLFRASVVRGGNEQLASATARQLLATNRLLLDSPAADDARPGCCSRTWSWCWPKSPNSRPSRGRDLDLINEGLEQGGVLSRLRTAVPSGASTNPRSSLMYRHAVQCGVGDRGRSR